VQIVGSLAPAGQKLPIGQAEFCGEVELARQKNPAEQGCSVEDIDPRGQPNPAVHAPLTTDNPLTAQNEPAQAIIYRKAQSQGMVHDLQLIRS
jgi:hypothetical protein